MSSLAIDRAHQAIRTFLTPGPRMVDELECVASILLAIGLAHLIGARSVSWAAFTALVLMRGHVSQTLARGVLRLVGTGLGAGLALLVVPQTAGSPFTAALAAGLVGGAAMYGTLTAKRSYAWLLFGLTFEMVLLDKLEHPGIDTVAFAQTRLIEVAAGTVACALVSLLSTLTLRRHWPGADVPAAQRTGWHPDAARHAAQTGLALALLPLLTILVDIPELWQASVTIMAVMIVPAASIGSSGLRPVSRRLLLRVAGCVAGGALAAAILLLAQGWPPLLIAGTCIGVTIGRHIENGATRLTYLGLQFTLAILVVLVPDSYADVSIAPALERLISIFVGMAIVWPVLFIWHAFASSAPAGADDGAAVGGE